MAEQFRMNECRKERMKEGHDNVGKDECKRKGQQMQRQNNE